MQEINVPIQAEQDARTLVERRAAGRALRNKAPRSSHAAWAPAINRPVPLSLLEEQNRSRLAHLVPLRFQRMAVSPFTFLRGSAIVMAQDLAATPRSEEHTSELQSLTNLVCRLLLEKKKKTC